MFKILADASYYFPDLGFDAAGGVSKAPTGSQDQLIDRAIAKTNVSAQL